MYTLISPKSEEMGPNRAQGDLFKGFNRTSSDNNAQ